MCFSVICTSFLKAIIIAQVLVHVHADIIPHLTKPHLLTDVLTRALDAGGLSGMLALHGIFTLVTKHGLEYPHFYRRLYNLLTPAALKVSKHTYPPNLYHCPSVLDMRILCIMLVLADTSYANSSLQSVLLLGSRVIHHNRILQQ